MPITTQTALSPSSTNSYESVALNFAEAVAKSVGTDVKKTADGRNYVLMDVIGYPGWCFMTSHDSTSIGFQICRTTTNKTPDDNDEFVLKFFHTNKPVDSVTYEHATCVMIYDNNKDSVSFNVHRGETQHGTDITVNENDIDVNFFFAKDANNEVLCGLGRLFIMDIRTLSARSNILTPNNPQKSSSISGCLHLTKMLNYLSPECPEMKSAYVSVLRPLSDTSQKYVALYNINGISYGRTSFVDSLDTNNIADYKCYYPFDPFIKY